MTALAARRRRSTIVAASVALVAVLVAVALVAVGALALYNSTEGADAADRHVETAFAGTPNGLLAAVDDEGQLASVAVLTARPRGRGGSIVTFPVSADASSGFGRERLPLAETVALDGVEMLEREVESLLSIDIDRTAVVDAAALEALLAPVGDLEVDLPIDVRDRRGREVAAAGRQTLDDAGAAAVLTARDPDQPAIEQFPAASAVWEAVARAVGEGSGVPTGDGAAAASAGPNAEPATVEELFGALTEGRVRERALRSLPFKPAENPRDVDVVRLDPAEIRLVFGQISPGQVSAPNASLSFRVESRFADEQLEGTELSNADVAYEALTRLIFTGGNVISVNTTSAGAPEVTTIYVSEESMRAGVEAGAPDLFGDVVVELAENRIAGVDAVIELGESFLATMKGASDGPAAASSTPATTGTTAAASGTDEPDDTDEEDE